MSFSSPKQHPPRNPHVRRRLLYCIIAFASTWVFCSIWTYSYSAEDAIFRQSGTSDVPHLPLPLETILKAGQYKMNTAGLEIRPHYFGYPENVDTGKVSIMTQMGMSRLQRLVDIRENWHGYISVTFYYTNLSQLKQFEKQWKASKLHGDTNVSVHVVLNTGYKGNNGAYCTNMMRNVAMEHAVTDYVLLLDGDFIPSPNMDLAIERMLPTFQNNMTSTALIIPAFERYAAPKQSVAVHDLVSTREQLREHFKPRSLLNKLVSATHLYAPAKPDFQPAQFPTDFGKWLDATVPYQVKYKWGYEPYPVVEKSTVPRFWEHLAGFGVDKSSWFEELALAGYSFVVLPDVFITHTNHPESSDYVRVIRPQNTVEYVRNFQPYLNRTYGRIFFTPEELTKWEKHFLDIFENTLKHYYGRAKKPAN